MKSIKKQRVIWQFNPITRIKQSKKIYNRKKFKNSFKKIYLENLERYN